MGLLIAIVGGLTASWHCLATAQVLFATADNDAFGECSTLASACSLGTAFSKASSLSGSVTVELAPGRYSGGLYNFSLSSGDAVTLRGQTGRAEDVKLTSQYNCILSVTGPSGGGAGNATLILKYLSIVDSKALVDDDWSQVIVGVGASLVVDACAFTNNSAISYLEGQSSICEFDYLLLALYSNWIPSPERPGPRRCQFLGVFFAETWLADSRLAAEQFASRR